MLADKIFSMLDKARPEPMTAITIGYMLLVFVSAVLMVCSGSSFMGGPRSLDMAMDTLFAVVVSVLVTTGIIGTGALARITPSPFKQE